MKKSGAIQEPFIHILPSNNQDMLCIIMPTQDLSVNEQLLKSIDEHNMEVLPDTGRQNIVHEDVAKYLLPT